MRKYTGEYQYKMLSTKDEGSDSSGIELGTAAAAEGEVIPGRARCDGGSDASTCHCSQSRQPLHCRRGSPLHRNIGSHLQAQDGKNLCW